MTNDRSIFLRNVPFAANEEDVRAAINQQIGGCKRVHLIRSRDPGGGHSGLAYADFEYESYREIAIQDGSVLIFDRVVRIERVKEHGEKR